LHGVDGGKTTPVASNERTFDATPEQIWAVLADPLCYDRWVVGAQDIRTADGTWPEPASSLHHTSGLGPLHLKDNTKVVESEPPRRLVLEARGRPIGIARVEIRLEPKGSATLVTMVEHPVRPTAANELNLVLSPFLHTRNAEALSRLEDTVRERIATG